MTRDLRTDEARNELASWVAGCFTMQEIPLVVMSGVDQDLFVPWMAGLVRGCVIRSYDPYPVTRFIETLDRLDYVFLRLTDDIPDDVYLLARDYALDRETPLRTRLGSHEIHPDHRLAIFIDAAALGRLDEHLASVLMRACTVNMSRAGEEPRRAAEPGPLERVEDAVQICDRYYGNGRFLFRGQTRDWPLAAPIHRITGERDHRREAQRTLDFVGWLAGGNSLIEGDPLSEDQALAVAQHHGLRTPLLDVSRNPRIAAFFATHGADAEADREGVLYIFHEADLKKHMNLDGDLGDELGRGLIEPKVGALRRIRHQQGLFFESRPWLIEDLVLARLRFSHKPRGMATEELFAPPREFIYPPPSALERVVETYLLVDEASGVSERDADEVYPAPQPTFDSTGLAQRAYLDEPGTPQPPLVKPHQTLDGYAGMLALSCSHLLAHQAHYLTAVLDGGQFLRDGSLTVDVFRELRRHLRGAHAHMNKPHATRIDAVPLLSIRDLVDGLALYHDVRSGSSNVTGAQFDAHLAKPYPRLRAAYACADHWLGDLAWDAFPIAAAFALNCRQPVKAYLDALVEIGRHGGEFLARYDAASGAQILSQWTGHEPIAVDDLLQQIPLPPFQQRAIDRLRNWRKAHPDRVADLGPFLFRQQDLETVRELMPQFTIHSGCELRVLKHDTDIAQAVYPISMEASLFEGLCGVATTMRCQATACVWNRFRICGRLPAAPASPGECTHRETLEKTYKLSVEQLDAFVAS